MRAFPLAVSIIIMLCALCSCDYPEQGFYELVGIDADGNAVGSQLFIIEEYVDDTEMTTGFGMLLPASDGRHLISVPIINSESREFRGWHLSTTGRQCGLADLDLDIAHINDRLKLDGLLHVLGLEGADEFHMAVREDGADSEVLFVGDAPRMPVEFKGALRFRLNVLSEDAFRERCGRDFDSPRIPMQPRDMLESEEAGETDQASDPGPDRGRSLPPAKP